MWWAVIWQNCVKQTFITWDASAQRKPSQQQSCKVEKQHQQQQLFQKLILLLDRISGLFLRNMENIRNWDGKIVESCTWSLIGSSHRVWKIGVLTVMQPHEVEVILFQWKRDWKTLGRGHLCDILAKKKKHRKLLYLAYALRYWVGDSLLSPQGGWEPLE